ncbi:DUF218 domain-containing protein [Candidatus Falkowbacteria bacterium]|jgi:SanA protein|nr:DUF218 domain-containing protein [Candidatus Falkowbacteria bacterium]MBT5503778.1 DUF218 domain-containing protein [Candidatus Falkowbacteria bacterium]MBT6573933.1 DUF218 domain-containing protein [Candidatus Falkowbacteria bacterium]MBT7348344.1 DUF218 domain-containing protein [Candidatus Falkowbacteria bacterium]MBT7500272.1 DUF218 domain-containing protein [Candidatus Falkowbacteria bacterium]
MDIGIERGSTNSGSSEFRKTTRTIIFVLLLFCLFVFLIMARVQFKYGSKIVNPESLSPPNVALVFGAGLKARGVPGVVLQDRVISAIRLYQEGRVGRFIMSGDNSTANHNEVQAMKNFALDNGLPEEMMLFDHAGLSTYDSCKNIKEQFELNSVVLITQKYHLRRALYICNELGVDAVGVIAQNTGYGKQFKFTVREWGASFQAWFDLIIK